MVLLSLKIIAIEDSKQVGKSSLQVKEQRIQRQTGVGMRKDTRRHSHKVLIRKIEPLFQEPLLSTRLILMESLIPTLSLPECTSIGNAWQHISDEGVCQLCEQCQYCKVAMEPHFSFFASVTLRLLVQQIVQNVLLQIFIPICRYTQEQG